MTNGFADLIAHSYRDAGAGDSSGAVDLVDSQYKGAKETFRPIYDEFIKIDLKGEAPTARLEESGNFNAMVSHRVPVTKQSEVDAEVERWLKKACVAP